MKKKICIYAAIIGGLTSAVFGQAALAYTLDGKLELLSENEVYSRAKATIKGQLGHTCAEKEVVKGQAYQKFTIDSHSCPTIKPSGNIHQEHYHLTVIGIKSNNTSETRNYNILLSGPKCEVEIYFDRFGKNIPSIFTTGCVSQYRL